MNERNEKRKIQNESELLVYDFIYLLVRRNLSGKRGFLVLGLGTNGIGKRKRTCNKGVDHRTARLQVQLPRRSK